MGFYNAYVATGYEGESAVTGVVIVGSATVRVEFVQDEEDGSLIGLRRPDGSEVAVADVLGWDERAALDVVANAWLDALDEAYYEARGDQPKIFPEDAYPAE